jgi:sporulation protein YunB
MPGGVKILFKRRRPVKTFLLGLILLFTFLSLFFWVDWYLRPSIFKIAEFKATQMATEAINQAIQQKVKDNNLQYQDFVQVHKDKQGRIVLIQANTVKTNQLAADITLAVQSTLQRLTGQTLSIPLGQLTGTYLLASRGPRVKVTIMPVGMVLVDVADKFEQAGINQTHHYIYLDFQTKIRIAIPTMKKETQVATKVPLAESVIVGEVPSTYVNISGGLFGGGIIK